TPLRREPAVEKDLRVLAALARHWELPPEAPRSQSPSHVQVRLEALTVTVAGVFNIPSDNLRLVQTMLAGLLPRYERTAR
ncbi:MAG: hypothetical protein AB1758_29135, partial [Candidatus Eremiobacterota bacterium]